MKKITLFLLFILPLTSFAEDRIKIAVIDTGVFQHMQGMEFMCKEKPKSFINKDPYDSHGHGSNIIGIIGRSINPKTHCIVSLKFYHQGVESGEAHLKASIKALKHVIKDKKIRYLNLSMGGPEADGTERLYIKRILIRGVVIVAAAGNEKDNLDTKEGKYYPASYRDSFKFSNFYVVKSLLSNSNYGNIVTDTFSGINVRPKPGILGVRPMSGTSQAAAQKMAEILKNVVLYSTGDVNGQQKANKRGKCY